MRRRTLAYGSNLCPEQMRQRCPAAEPGGMVALEGWRFIINRRGVATLLPCPGERAWGQLQAGGHRQCAVSGVQSCRGLEA